MKNGKLKSTWICVGISMLKSLATPHQITLKQLHSKQSMVRMKKYGTRTFAVSKDHGHRKCHVKHASHQVIRINCSPFSVILERVFFIVFNSPKTLFIAKKSFNACPLHRDYQLLVHYKNIPLLKQFMCPTMGNIMSPLRTGICLQAHLELEVALSKFFSFIYNRNMNAEVGIPPESYQLLARKFVLEFGVTISADFEISNFFSKIASKVT